MIGTPDPIVGRRGTGAIAPVGDVSDNHAGTAPKMKPRGCADKRQSRGGGEALSSDAALLFMTEERREFDRQVVILFYAHTHTHPHSHTLSLSHAYVHAHVHVHAHTHTHTRTHDHTRRHGFARRMRLWQPNWSRRS